MFNTSYRESLSSTGEPPTLSPDNSTQILCGDSISDGHEETPVSFSSGSRSRTLSVHEPDSGYEASPSSIADNQTFFGERTMAVTNQIDLLQSCSTNSDEEFNIVECHSQILFSESESELEDYDFYQDCCGSLRSCSNCRTDSSTTYTTAISNCDNSRCNSSDLSYNRPSSQPIQIPNLPVCEISPEFRSRLELSLGSLIDMYPQARSLPLNFSGLQTLGLFSENHNLSWPSTVNSLLRNGRNTVALASPRSHHIRMSRDIPARCRSHNHPRSRRQIIDSEASSFGSSDDEGPEDVFTMASGEASSFPMMTVGSGPLPDIILDSQDYGRRSRSVSVSLPLERRQEVIREVGQTLRRMSDLFVQRRELRMAVMRARSRTGSECDEPHPNGLS